ncbi:response regulator [Roseateles terrae]|uniref:histidine kinase n=1 Tax=Roseateles terrae TaxID=431060 RepID=A0ABR6GKX1_9BURK|nr:response regulator [Roseateles terrae]MBB3192752.1 CheY-like chemotaxis protein/CHASE3 domain sensor protein [Roseateles terrae]OWQ89970.1 histidine kinase [Roseateles terrae]
MPHSSTSPLQEFAHHRIRWLPAPTMLGFALAILTIFMTAFMSWRSQQEQSATADAMARTLAVQEQIQALGSAIKDAETGQRGYLLTGTDTYLLPFNTAQVVLPLAVQRLKVNWADNTPQLARLDTVEMLYKTKLAEMEETIAMRRQGDRVEAVTTVQGDRGRILMDRIRTLLGEMEREERERAANRRETWDAAVVQTQAMLWGGSALLLVLVLVSMVLTIRSYRAAKIEEWLKAGQAALGAELQGDPHTERLGEIVVSFLARYTRAQVGAFYVAKEGGEFERVAGYALPTGEAAPAQLRSGDSLLGQAARDRHPVHLKRLPKDYFNVASALGRASARELLIGPAGLDGGIQCAVELGYLHEVGQPERELLARVAESIAMALRAAKDRSRLESLLEESRRQSEELQAQQEELRASNEELEEQGRALRESQLRLEHQQTELEQSNAQLEEQAKQLEMQRSDLESAQGLLTERADALERSNQYKSEFLANMSHELRTPLNSTLILAKLLADNKDGNLTQEQVRFAETITSAGNDLLALINDILDLSKIEAGKVDVQIERVPVHRMLQHLTQTFSPIAAQRNLAFGLHLQPGAPEWLETDESRISQVLKNLLSNALKFTEKGSVRMEVGGTADGRLVFAVKDTGIGIAPEHQEQIFEAFRQADGSTHRKYGGTGLGLSISRDLARLLGGDIYLESSPGLGSTFSLVLPQHHVAPAEDDRPRPLTPAQAPAPARMPMGAPPAMVPAATSVATGTMPAVGGGGDGEVPSRPAPASHEARLPQLDDDRLRWVPGARSILVIEDDERFAAILRDLIREMNFLCLLAHTAENGLAVAQRYAPSAILLDMNLPDHSGLGVLDRLKRDPLTRHIPVHVASVEDYSHEALERGAIGYALKPVKRDELESALQRLEAKFSQRMRRVLVVEDDARQLDSIRHLLAADDVQIQGVSTAAEALEALRNTTFDCMVMDLHLPDMSGFDLLDQMALQDEVAFPPVIVYTGHNLSPVQETQLRRYSRSIIIKGARSPERLLDEVTLFLHQVEAQLPPERQRMLKEVRARDNMLEGRRVLVVEDDVRNIFALSAVLEPKGVKVEIARNGREALERLAQSAGPTPGEGGNKPPIDLVLMDIMMPEMDGFTAMRAIRERPDWRRLPIIALTAKAMKDDQEKCMAAGANDYIAKPLDVEKLLSLIRVWMPR